jgi:hypothetical protein
VLLAQAGEHVAEALAVLVQLSLTRGPSCAPPAVHGGVEVAGEGQASEPGAPVRTGCQSLQVAVAEVPMGETHGLAPVLSEYGQGLGMVFGAEKAHLAPDQLDMGVRATYLP